MNSKWCYNVFVMPYIVVEIQNKAWKVVFDQVAHLVKKPIRTSHDSQSFIDIITHLQLQNISNKHITEKTF